MGKIKILPEHIINKIAAGEVVERPASVVKELVENSLDAGATQIKINVIGGGTKKITVTDNGEGMDKEDLLKCYHRHGTSKISSEEDLFKIQSMGFRGEALASVAAVSKMIIQSKTASPTVGTSISLSGGKLEKTSPVGMPRGTSITISDLFYNVPARKKFLKTSSTEFRHILDSVTGFALAFPQIGILLTHNQKTIFNIPQNQKIEERVRNLLGKTYFEHLIPVFFDHRHLRIKGFIAKPQLTSQRRQFLFVNQRAVAANLIRKAVREAYGTLLPPKTYPLFVLFLTLPHETVDVNVHPRKEEIKFMNPNFIFNSVRNTVQHTLQKADLTFTAQTLPGRDISRSKPPPVTQPPTPSTSFIPTRQHWEVHKLQKSAFEKLPPEPLPWEKEEFEKTGVFSEILQVHNLYLITQTQDGILIIDQHAAHERVLYEQFLQDFQKKRNTNKSQPLLLTRSFDLPTAEAKILKENLSAFQKLGLEIEEFGENTFKVSSVPNILREHNIVSLINEVLKDLIAEKPPQKINNKNLRTLSYLSCRSAVKAGDYLSPPKRQNLLKNLSLTKTEYTCPHGRPVKIKISLGELEKAFKRG